MPAETLIFLNDRFHFSNTAASVHSVSSTQSGYNKELVRDTNMKGAWKPSDSSIDEYIQADGGSTGWLGSIAYCAIAYDARGADQTLIKLMVDAADNPAGTFATNKGTFTVNTTRPTVDYLVILSTTNKRYWRLAQLNADRGGGTKTVKIFAWAMFQDDEVYSIDSEFPNDAIGASDIASVSEVGMLDGVGALHTNRNAGEYQEFGLNLDEATLSLWQTLRDQLFSQDGPGRAFWMQFEGLRNDALANFAMVRLLEAKRSAHRRLPNKYGMKLKLRTEPWF